MRALMQFLHGGTSEHLTLRILHPLQARLPIFRSPIALRHYDLHIPNLMKKRRCRDGGTMSCFWPLTRSAGLNQGSSLEQGLELKLGIGHVTGGARVFTACQVTQASKLRRHIYRRRVTIRAQP